MSSEAARERAREIVTTWFNKQWPTSSNLDPHIDCDYGKLTKEITLALDALMAERDAARDECKRLACAHHVMVKKESGECCAIGHVVSCWDERFGEVADEAEQMRDERDAARQLARRLAEVLGSIAETDSSGSVHDSMNDMMKIARAALASSEIMKLLRHE